MSKNVIIRARKNFVRSMAAGAALVLAVLISPACGQTTICGDCDLDGDIGDGSARVRLSTVNGAIKIRKS